VEEMPERFKLFLDENGEIQLRIDGQKFEMSKTMALSMKYKLHEVIGLKLQWDDINGWKPAYIEDDTL
jgi:hypothetical protein